VALETQHFRLFIAARWQSYRNSLRRSGIQRAKFLTALLAWIIAAIGGLGSALAFGGIGYSAGSRARTPLLGLGLFFVFALWQLAPIIFEATSPTINFRDIARYPVTFRTYCLLHLAYGLLDPAVVLGLLWLLSLWIGLLLGRAAWALQAVIPFLLFTVFNLLASRFVMTLLERMLATRKGRERVLLGLLLLAIATQIAFYGFLPRLGSAGMKAFAVRLIPLWTWFPPGLATWSIAAPLSGFAIAMVALSAYVIAATLPLRWQLRSVFSGEIYSESRRVSGAVQLNPGWKLPFLSGRTSAIVEKELRYCWRDSRTLMNIAMPTIFALMIVISRGAFARTMATGLKVQSTEPRLQVTFSAAAIFLLAYLAYNCFGFEGAGFQRWPLSPATSREILVGKNLAVCLLWIVSLLAVNSVFFVAGNFSFLRFGLSLIGVTYGALAVLAAGNQFSIRMPTKVESGSITSKVLSQGVIFGSFVLAVTLGGSAWLTVRLASSLSRPWITPVGLTLLASVAACLYVVSLRNAARYLDRNIEKISAELQ
jgi:hypothetical protein